eukprot:scaffold1281_cov32-Phaeocystis_antarctica.AAC.3
MSPHSPALSWSASALVGRLMSGVPRVGRECTASASSTSGAWLMRLVKSTPGAQGGSSIGVSS